MDCPYPTTAFLPVVKVHQQFLRRLAVKHHENKNINSMKFTKHILTAVLLTGLAAGVLSARADDKHEHADKKAKPYPLKTCIVSGEEINDKGEMKPHAFVVEGQEVKLCCKSCLKDFNKDKAGYLKKIEAEARKQKK